MSHVDLHRAPRIRRCSAQAHLLACSPLAGTGESGKGLYDGFVTNIHICDTHIDGPVPRELCAFSKLRELDLDGGHLTGPIPEWLVDCFQGLAELDLSYNRVGGWVGGCSATHGWLVHTVCRNVARQW
jgi:hypothetical protein